MRLSRVIVALFFFAGVVLLGTMVWRIGLTGFVQSLRVIGPWLAPFLLLEAVPQLLHAVGWAACFQGPRPPLRLWQLFLVRLAGSAINQMTPTANVGGEVVRVLLLESTLPREQAVASVIIGKASVTIAQTIYLSLGALYLMWQLPLPRELQWGLSITLGLVSLGLAGFVALQRYGVLSKCISGLGSPQMRAERLQRFGERLRLLDQQLIVYYTTSHRRFLRSLLLHFLAFAFDGLKTYILLRLILGTAAPVFTQALLVAVAVAALDQMFFFVPGRLGTLEGVRFTVLSTLGVAQVYGLAFGLIARIEHLVWSGLGLLAYALCARVPQLLQPCSPLTQPWMSVSVVPRK
jgi:uncharacterized protein (TIRG00374 family)